MKKIIYFILVFVAYIIMALFAMKLLFFFTELYWFIGVLVGLLFASLLCLNTFSFKFKISVGVFISILATVITTFLNYHIFTPYSNDHYSTDYRKFFAAISPKNENGEPNIQFVEQVTYFVIAFVVLLFLVRLAKIIMQKRQERKT